ncbi:flagellar export chaperone FliS [Sporomusa sphaeroides]|uniref:Flagellar secretion chaperone FliS n=1 Tax=Sporomusa sphaeroides DSM 2875 TaxID=1337886 RepID=A0ABM9W4G4_9FIRM|nr:flagellar export chaperone FliS [Sporomusa sphaeroides]OLS55569.1 flagellar protein FliS [Sporomusa sphaeroides DSM 2875]CVK19894.1 Flagellar protein FliS [Sporomusa sphaeroides DSM 2875]
MNAANTANVYKNQQIMTASPEELTLMLYNGAIRFITESMQAIEQGNLERANAANLRAQDIVREFMCTLDMQYEISQNYYKLYDYIEYRLIQANIKKDKSQLEEAKSLLTELRDTWMQAMKLARGQQQAAAK